MALTDNTQKINELLTAIRNLPDAGNGSGGVQLPELNNPDGNPAEYLAKGWELIDENGNVVTGTVPSAENGILYANALTEDGILNILEERLLVLDAGALAEKTIVEKGYYLNLDAAPFGDARPEQVPYGITFSSKHGMNLIGEKTETGGTELTPIPDGEQGTANDLASGKKLYDDNGNIVEGTLPTYPTEMTESKDDPTYSAYWIEQLDGLLLSTSFTDRGIVEVGTDVGLLCSREELESLLPADFRGSGGSGGGTDLADAILDKTVTQISSTVKEVGDYVLRQCSSLITLDLPEAEAIGSYCCYNCNKLSVLNAPKVKTIGQYAFYACGSLTSVTFPMLTKLGGNRILSAAKLEFLDLGACTSMAANALNGCKILDTIVIRTSTVCTLDNVSALSSTPFASGGAGGTIYVPSSLISQYQTATNWSTLYSGGTCTFAAIEGSAYA